MVKVVRPDLAKQHKTVSNRIQDTVETVLFKSEINLKELDQKMDEHLVVTKELGSLSFSKDDSKTNDSDTLVIGMTEDGQQASVNVDNICIVEAVKALEQSKRTEKELKFANQLLTARYSEDKEMQMQLENTLIKNFIDELKVLRIENHAMQ